MEIPTIQNPLVLAEVIIQREVKDYSELAKVLARVQALPPESQYCLAQDLLAALKNRLVGFERCLKL